MRKALFNGTPLFAAKAATGDAYSELRQSMSGNLICPICKQPVILRNGEIRSPHFAHHKQDQIDCPYRSFYRKQTETYCKMLDDLIYTFLRFAFESGSACDIDVQLLPDHYSSFTLINSTHKYAFDIISWKFPSDIINKRISAYQQLGYQPMFIIEVKDENLLPQEFENIIFAQKSTLVFNTSSNKWALYSCQTETSSIQYIEVTHIADLHWIDGFTIEPNAIKEYLTLESYHRSRYPAEYSPVQHSERLNSTNYIAIKNKKQHDEKIKRMNEVYTAIKNHLPQIPFREAYNLRNRFIVENYQLFGAILSAIKKTDSHMDALHREMQKRNCDEQSMRQLIYAGAIQLKYPDTPESKRDAAVLCLFMSQESDILWRLRPLIML